MSAHAAWFLARGSGIVAYALVSASTIWGLALSTKVLGGGRRSRRLLLAHETIALGAVLATLVHVGALVADTYVHFGWFETLVPGASAWRPMAVAWGVTGFHALLVVTFSFYVRGRIGQRAWRWLHFGAFGAFAASTIHGLRAGTDAGTPVMLFLTVGATTIVVALAILRAATYGTRRHRPRPVTT